MSANQQARKILGSMAGRYGDVADICLEQGWTFLDEGDHDRAREWFIRASGARRTAEGRGVADLQGYACEELARLSRDAGNAGEALQWYRAALERSPGRSILRVAYADLLRKSGNLESAIEQYAAAMGYEGHTWPFPRVPRDIRELSFEGILPPGHGSPQHRTGCVDVSVMKLEGTGVRY
jgi:tetratricopeptide (TPR) repeat protein